MLINCHKTSHISISQGEYDNRFIFDYLDERARFKMCKSIKIAAHMSVSSSRRQLIRYRFD
uniref:Uncharacterized protein n=1 Tax=Loigolactobacillus rennini TaxID=238013 RepID=A0A1K2I7A1_9LACO|nr:hypothetical protein LREN565_1326 [Loigolactobacillus rennini]